MSTGLMNVGFIALFRVYGLMADTSIYPWIRSVLLIAGLLSLFLAAVQLSNVKYLTRMLALSSLEHIGIVLVCLSLGQAGFYAAILHLVLHSFIKAGLFLQVDQIQTLYQTNRLCMMGEYLRFFPLGGSVLLISFISLTAIPPSGMFVSEFMLFRALIENHRYAVLVLVLILLLILLYSLGRRFLDLLFTPHGQQEHLPSFKADPWHSLFPVAFLVAAVIIGSATPSFIHDLITRSIAAF
jgi:hydrogenase-4 component F